MRWKDTKEIVKTIACCYIAWVYWELDEGNKSKIYYEWHRFLRHKDFDLVKKAVMYYVQENSKVPEIYDIENALLKIN